VCRAEEYAKGQKVQLTVDVNDEDIGPYEVLLAVGKSCTDPDEELSNENIIEQLESLPGDTQALHTTSWTIDRDGSVALLATVHDGGALVGESCVSLHVTEGEPMAQVTVTPSEIEQGQCVTATIDVDNAEAVTVRLLNEAGMEEASMTYAVQDEGGYDRTVLDGTSAPALACFDAQAPTGAYRIEATATAKYGEYEPARAWDGVLVTEATPSPGESPAVCYQDPEDDGLVSHATNAAQQRFSLIDSIGGWSTDRYC
jgi:hypothetical protein